MCVHDNTFILLIFLIFLMTKAFSPSVSPVKYTVTATLQTLTRLTIRTLQTDGDIPNTKIEGTAAESSVTGIILMKTSLTNKDFGMPICPDTITRRTKIRTKYTRK